MNVLFFSDEYIKSTKGMFRVWSCQALEACESNQVHILLNKEHWAYKETTELFGKKANVVVTQLGFRLPEEYINVVLEPYSSNLPIKVLRKFLYNIFSFFSFPFFTVYLVVKLNKIKPDVVYNHNGGWPGGKLSRLVMFASKLLGVKNRISIIHNFPAKQNLLLRLFYSVIRAFQARLIKFSATKIVTVSDALRQVLEKDVFSESIVRIYNGIPENINFDRSQNLDNFPNWKRGAHPVVGFIGSLAPPKAPHTLVEAYGFVKTKSELALLGPGDSDYIQYLKNISANYKNPVSFLGFHNDVNRFLEQVNLLVVPSSHFESFGMVIIEAMRMKLPVICTDFGGMKEVVVNDETGLVVPAGDVQAMADAIDSLLMNPNRMMKMGLAGYQRFTHEFTSSKMNSEYEKLCINP